MAVDQLVDHVVVHAVVVFQDVLIVVVADVALEVTHVVVQDVS